MIASRKKLEEEHKVECMNIDVFEVLGESATEDYVRVKDTLEKKISIIKCDYSAKMSCEIQRKTIATVKRNKGTM